MITYSTNKRKMKSNFKTFFLSVASVSMLAMLIACSPTTSESESVQTSDPATQTSEPVTSSESTSTSESVLSLKEKHNAISIKEALELATAAGETQTKPYNVYGFIDSITNPTYGGLTLKDDEASISVYGLNNWNTMDPRPVAGDEIVLKGCLKTFKGTPELGKSDVVEFIHTEVEIDESVYNTYKILDARNKEPGTKVKLQGVVAKITYTQGMMANGYYLVDDTNSIYVYDKDNATFLKEGNQITILGERANYISDKETESAQKFGYQGCIQVSNVILRENDKGNHPINKDWINEASIKDILEAPMDHNITTTIYKVTGIINKAVGAGFINYYINDLDNATGSYVYTSNSGKDFAYLDQFDGKFCEILLSPINAKCTSSGCLYRFMPIEVKTIDYHMEDKNVTDFVIEYYVEHNFLDEYKSDPSLVLETTYSNELLGFEGVKVSYKSSDTSMVEFVNDNDKVVMHVKGNGNPTITITATYKTFTSSLDIKFVINLITVPDHINVKGAIDAEVNTLVTVKGIVMSSLINQDGFYLCDESGIIAVLINKETLKTIELGNEVYVRGLRSIKSKRENDPGNICLKESELILNTYGNHPYSKASFDTTTTIEQLAELSVNDMQHTAMVHSLKAKISKTESKYATNYFIKSLTSDKDIMLYSSNKSQYAWLDEFVTLDSVTVEFTLCNWNSKTAYKGCVVAVTTDTKTVVNNYNFA